MVDLTFQIVITINLLCISFCDWNVKVYDEMKVHWHAISGATYNFMLFIFGIESKGWNLKLHLQILRDLGVRSMKLMTNNPAKYVGLKGYGLTISGRIPLLSLVTKENKRYLETKRVKMGHVYGLPESGNGKAGSGDDSNAAPGL